MKFALLFSIVLLLGYAEDDRIALQETDSQPQEPADLEPSPPSNETHGWEHKRGNPTLNPTTGQDSVIHRTDADFELSNDLKFKKRKESIRSFSRDSAVARVRSHTLTHIKGRGFGLVPDEEL